MKTHHVLMAMTLLILSARGKKNDTKATSTGDNNNDNNNGNNTICTATKTDAENITIFPADNAWNQDVSKAAADPYSSQIITTISTARVKADFGAGLYENLPIGIPYTVVCGSQPK